MTGINLRQSAGNAVSLDFSTCSVVLNTKTLTGSLIVVVATAVKFQNDGTISFAMPYDSGFTQARVHREGQLAVSVWYRAAAPADSILTVTASNHRSLQVRVFEFTGIAQSSALDKVTVGGDDGNTSTMNSGTTGTTSQADELVLGVASNRHPSTTQYGFTGGLSRLTESLTPTSDADGERSRMTVHAGVTTSTGSFQLRGQLATSRDWIAMVLTFRGASLGPARMASTGLTPLVTVGGRGDLTVFGALSSKPTTPMFTAGGNAYARIGPFDYQYRLGGWSGLLIGDDTPYTVESHSGLEGWQMRTSDDEFPRGDGALRGVDLQTARQILFKLKIGSDSAGAHAQQVDVEDALDTLYRALVPQRDADWELIWRHPGRPLRMLRCRPIDLLRDLDWVQTVVGEQPVALLAADPRHYSAQLRQVRFAAQSAGGTGFTSVLNEGNSFAYPTLRINGPSAGSVQRIQVDNITYDLSFAVETTLPSGSTLLGDMEARATGAARSVVTIDDQTKYGAWQFPRETFRLGPGENRLRLTTVPADPSVMCQLEYRDTWSG